jgi:hypothetical protein
LHCFFFGYITAELAVRFAYDSIYMAPRTNSNNRIPTDIGDNDFTLQRTNKNEQHTENGQLIEEEQSATNDNVDPPAQCCSSIYEWEKDFRFVTIVLCTYTVAYILLIHLTCTFIFLYTTQKTSYIAFLKYILGSILKGGM